MSQFRRTLWDSLHFSTNLRLSQLIPSIAWGRGAGCHTHPGGPCWGPQSQPPPAESGKGTGGGHQAASRRHSARERQTVMTQPACTALAPADSHWEFLSLAPNNRSSLLVKEKARRPPRGRDRSLALPQAPVTEIPTFFPTFASAKGKNPNPNPRTPSSREIPATLRDKAGQRANSKRQWLLRSGASAGTSARGQTPLPSSLAWNAAWPSAPPPGGPAAGLTSGKVQAGGRRAGLRVRCPSPWSPPHPLF